ncbi:MAG: hypothetical protein KGK11_08410 [Sphingomonadales bacterium]|nr:hypothetical protein [Sphingomonadales bacterium]
MFLGPKLSTVFASRWKALAWSAGVLLTAYCSIPSQDGSGGAGGATSAVIGVLGGGAADSASTQVSPWAPDKASSGAN